MVLLDFFRANAWRRAIPHAWRLLGLPPEMVGRWEALYAPIPRRTTLRAVGKLIFFVGLALLYFDKNSFSFLSSAALNLMLEDAEAEALPRLLVALPLIRSLLGAGVWAAPLRPALFCAIFRKKETPSCEEVPIQMSKWITCATPWWWPPTRPKSRGCEHSVRPRMYWGLWCRETSS